MLSFGQTRADAGRRVETSGVQAGGSDARPPNGTRRERVREATVTEIKQTARRLLVSSGVAGVSLRAIARDMGITAPGLYRYYSGLDDLLASLQVDYFEELTAHVRSAIAALPDSDLDGQTNAAARAFRGWATTYPAEFTLLFGPTASHHAGRSPHESVYHAGMRFGAAFFTLFFRIWADERFTPPREDEVPERLAQSLAPFAEVAAAEQGAQIPIGAVHVLSSVWVRLYGLICIEVFQQLDYLVSDMQPLFEAELHDLLAGVGVQYRPPEEGDAPVTG